MFKKKEKGDSMGNWRIYDDKGRMRAVIYSTELTERAIDKAEKLADATCLLFNSLKANATYMDNGTDKLLDDVMKLDNLSAIDLAKKLQLPIGHYYIPKGYKDSPKPLAVCMIHERVIVSEIDRQFNIVKCPYCNIPVTIAAIEDYEKNDPEEAADIFRENTINKLAKVIDPISLAQCACGAPLPDDNELCADCQKAATKKSEKERDDYENEGKRP